MRFIVSLPMLAVVIAAYNLLGFSGSMLQSESLLFETTLPSGEDIFFNVGHVFVLAGLVALFFEILKAARLSNGTIVDHMLSTVTFIVALIEFLLVPVCGTVTFFLLTAMALIDVVAGFSVSIFSARRDYSVNRGGDGLL